ncbi:hypothetical protein BC628DRAFT_1505477 [Trametes gibbosa]|nr:hypothetical protein BC628DRAFT_1505477 [Trametes gibbosa]
MAHEARIRVLHGRTNCLSCNIGDTYDEDGEHHILPELPGGSVEELRTLNTTYQKGVMSFWDSYRKVFASVGITLYDLRLYGKWILSNMVPSQRPAVLPFANGCRHTSPLTECFLQYYLGCGQDDMQCNVIIKLVDHGTDEHQIYSRLSRCEALYDPCKFAGVLPPTAILTSPHGFSFVVMPMWTTAYRLRLQQLDTIRQVFSFIRCTLMGLSLLHTHRIAHRDIDDSNIVTNWFCYDNDWDHRLQRILEHCQTPDALYALFDFDLSIQLPAETSLKHCRRPADEALIGKSFYHPGDITMGESYYNPFAYDVACLANIFIFHFSEAIPLVPLLAPLFGKMTISPVANRFTAEEALTFFREIEAACSPEVLDGNIVLKASEEALDDPNVYWARVSPDMQRRWQSHRPMLPTRTIRLLRWAMCNTFVWRTVVYVRDLLYI